METKNKIGDDLLMEVGGCLPDIVSLDGAPDDVDISDFRDEIQDYVSDRSVDMYPDITDDARSEMIRMIVEYYCGKEETEKEICKFPVEALHNEEG